MRIDFGDYPPGVSAIQPNRHVRDRSPAAYGQCLSKSISDAGWNHFLTILPHKAAEAGVVVVVVNPAGTSRVCSGCGRMVPKTLSDRWHTCPYEDCGLSLQRDHNSAREILNRAGLSDPLRGYPVAVAPAAESQRL